MCFCDRQHRLPPSHTSFSTSNTDFLFYLESHRGWLCPWLHALKEPFPVQQLHITCNIYKISILKSIYYFPLLLSSRFPAPPNYNTTLPVPQTKKRKELIFSFLPTPLIKEDIRRGRFLTVCQNYLPFFQLLFLPVSRDSEDVSRDPNSSHPSMDQMVEFWTNRCLKTSITSVKSDNFCQSVWVLL